ncbi:MAG: hypothetical protein QXT45_05790 [Candidatus Bilamarchaeaceae archaeon]
MKIAIIDGWRFVTGREAQFLLRLNRSTEGWWWRNCHRDFEEAVLPKLMEGLGWREIDRYYPTVLVFGVGKTIFVPPDTIVRITGGGSVESAPWYPGMEPPVGYCVVGLGEVIETWKSINDFFIKSRMSN